MPPELLIFDCDGVLVDSEPLAMRLLLETLAGEGVAIEADSAYRRFLGKDMAAIADAIGEEFGAGLSQPALDAMHGRLYELFRRELKPMPGIVAALEALRLPCCVASSSSAERIRLALDVTGLRARFEPNIFSAAMVARGKPAPDLFLFAAGRMGVAPAACVVIEDSPSGVEAAQRAGMAVFAFAGGAHAEREGHREALMALKPLLIFDDMLKLPALLRRMAPPRKGAQ
ncbi:MAG TPA: HAD family hydrolase [Propylenella sp.]